MTRLGILSLMVAACTPKLLPPPGNGSGSEEVDAGMVATTDAASPDAVLPVYGCATAPTIPGTGTIASWSRETGNQVVNRSLLERRVHRSDLERLRHVEQLHAPDVTLSRDTYRLARSSRAPSRTHRR